MGVGGGFLSAGVDGVLAADLMSVLPFTGGVITWKITVDETFTPEPENSTGNEKMMQSFVPKCD